MPPIIISPATSVGTGSATDARWLTVKSLLAPLKTLLRTTGKWTDAELYRCIVMAQTECAPLCWIEDIEDLTGVPAQRDYTLPGRVVRIISVSQVGGQAVSVTVDGVTDPGLTIPLQGWEHRRTPTTNTLRLNALQGTGATVRW
jgi:hypothetical protein